MLRFLRFGTVGLTVAAIDLSLVAFLQHLLPPLGAVTLAYFAGVTCHFLLNKHWVFRCRRSDHPHQVCRYAVNVAACWLLTVAVVHLALTHFTQSVLAAKLCALAPATVFGFCMMRFWIFPQHPTTKPSYPAGTMRRSV